jgi:hypothetical protein
MTFCEELMREPRVHMDHSTINRGVITYSPPLEEAFHHYKQHVWFSWRIDEIYIRLKRRVAPFVWCSRHVRGDCRLLAYGTPSQRRRVTVSQEGDPPEWGPGDNHDRRQ